MTPIRLSHLLRATLTLLVLAAILWAVFPLFFSASRVERWLIAGAKEQLGADLSIGHLTVRPTGLSLEQIALTNIGEAKPGYRVEAAKGNLRWQLLPLLRRRSWHVDRADFEGVRGFYGLSASDPKAYVLESGSVRLTRVESRALDGDLVAKGIRTPFSTGQDLAMQWQLSGIEPSLLHLTGWVRAHQGAGTIAPLDSVVSGPTDTIALLKLPCWASPCAVAEASGRVEIQNGALRLDSLMVRGPEIALEGKGEAALPSRVMALHLTARAPARKATLMVSLTGRMSAPQVHLDSFKQDAFEMQLRDLLKSLPEEARKKR